MNIITAIKSRDRKFYVVLFEGYYCAIEDTYLDGEGRLNSTLNGIQMLASDTKDECISRVMSKIEIEHLVDLGVDPLEATMKIIRSK